MWSQCFRVRDRVALTHVKLRIDESLVVETTAYELAMHKENIQWESLFLLEDLIKASNKMCRKSSGKGNRLSGFYEAAGAGRKNLGEL